jgi:hypothetical protein
MPTYTITNTIPQTSIKGQGVLVTVAQDNPTELSSLALLQEGTECIITASGNIGYATEIDKYGGTFRLKAQYPYSNLSNDIYNGILTENASIAFTI